MNRHEKARKVLKEGTMIPASPLALNQDRKFDEKRQRLLIKYYLESGVGGIAAAVHTTQFEIRKPQVGLFEPVLRVVSDEIDRYEKETGKVIVKIAGVCGETRQALAEAKTAEEYGYDALLLSPGGLSPFDRRGNDRKNKSGGGGDAGHRILSSAICGRTCFQL